MGSSFHDRGFFFLAFLDANYVKHPFIAVILRFDVLLAMHKLGKEVWMLSIC